MNRKKRVGKRTVQRSGSPKPRTPKKGSDWDEPQGVDPRRLQKSRQANRTTQRIAQGDPLLVSP